MVQLIGRLRTESRKPLKVIYLYFKKEFSEIKVGQMNSIRYPKSSSEAHTALSCHL